MATVEALQFRGRDGAISLLNNAIETLNITKEASSTTPAKAVFGSVSGLLTMTRVCHPPLQPWAAGSRLLRTLCQMNGITLRLGWPALKCAKPSIGHWVGEHQMNLASLYLERLDN